jgi:hypothetical protein
MCLDPTKGPFINDVTIMAASNVLFKKTVTIHSSDTVLWIVTVF